MQRPEQLSPWQIPIHWFAHPQFELCVTFECAILERVDLRTTGEACFGSFMASSISLTDAAEMAERHTQCEIGEFQCQAVE